MRLAQRRHVVTELAATTDTLTFITSKNTASISMGASLPKNYEHILGVI